MVVALRRGGAVEGHRQRGTAERRRVERCHPDRSGAAHLHVGLDRPDLVVAVLRVPGHGHQPGDGLGRDQEGCTRERDESEHAGIARTAVVAAVRVADRDPAARRRVLVGRGQRAGQAPPAAGRHRCRERRSGRRGWRPRPSASIGRGSSVCGVVVADLAGRRLARRRPSPAPRHRVRARRRRRRTSPRPCRARRRCPARRPRGRRCHAAGSDRCRPRERRSRSPSRGRRRSTAPPAARVRRARPAGRRAHTSRRSRNRRDPRGGARHRDRRPASRSVRRPSSSRPRRRSRRPRPRSPTRHPR